MTSFRIEETIRYDRDAGELQMLDGEGILREAIKVRTALSENILLHAVIIELERRGYVVTAPEDPW